MVAEICLINFVIFANKIMYELGAQTMCGAIDDGVEDHASVAGGSRIV